MFDLNTVQHPFMQWHLNTFKMNGAPVKLHPCKFHKEGVLYEIPWRRGFIWIPYSTHLALATLNTNVFGSLPLEHVSFWLKLENLKIKSLLGALIKKDEKVRSWTWLIWNWLQCVVTPSNKIKNPVSQLVLLHVNYYLAISFFILYKWSEVLIKSGNVLNLFKICCSVPLNHDVTFKLYSLVKKNWQSYAV